MALVFLLKCRFYTPANYIMILKHINDYRTQESVSLDKSGRKVKTARISQKGRGTKTQTHTLSKSGRGDLQCPAVRSDSAH